MSAAEIERVYRAHFAFVWRSLRHLGVRERDLADATHDVFLVVHRKLPSFDGAAKVTTWLYGICFRVASQRRRRAYTRRELLRDSDPEIPDPGLDAAEQLERKQGRALLDALLDAMTMEQRAAFTLFEIEGMSRDEIADLLGVPSGTVASRLRKARAIFRTGLGRLHARWDFEEQRMGERS